MNPNRPHKPLSQTDLDALDLPRFFPENQATTQPLAASTLEPLQSPDDLAVIPLPVRDRPPRVLIADDDERFIEGLKRSLAAFYPGALDLRFWVPRGTSDLVETLNQYLEDGWRPDAVVIDINFDDGGKHGVHYLEDLRCTPGRADLAVVLATGNQFRDLDEGRLTRGTGDNKTHEPPTEWLRKAKPLEPEGILYGKTGDAKLLGRIGEHIDDWKRAARRRAWVRLLQEVAQLLDGKSIRIDVVANHIVKYAITDLSIGRAFVYQRRREPDGEYKLVAAGLLNGYGRNGDSLAIESVPILAEIVEQNRRHVCRESLSADEAGRYVNEIEGMAFLGAGCVLGNRNVGIISMLRDPGAEPFDDAVDGRHISILARLMASAMRVATLRDRQIHLLRFANEASSATDRSTVCERLAATLHEEVHQGDDADAKATVRLLDFGTGDLTRLVILGFPAADLSIHLTTEDSIYAQVVRDNRFALIGDCAERARVVQTAAAGEIRSELCVPLSIGHYAIGAVNLEHRQVDFYRDYDADFVQAAGSLAANAIGRIRTAKLLEEMTNFVHRFSSQEPAALNQRLRDLLYEFCGYSVLVDLAPLDEPDMPWHVTHIECRFKGANERNLEREMTEALAESWVETWVGRLYAQKAWREHWAEFTDDEENFGKINLTPEGEHSTHQKADAILWLRRAEDAPPHRALLLMWGLPPPMNETDVILLGNMARLFSELDARKEDIRQLVRENLIGEQAKQIGHVMQHFRHRLGNLTGGQENHIDLLEAALKNRDTSGAFAAASQLRKSVSDIANAFHRSRGYVKAVEMQSVRIRAVIDRALQDLDARLAKVTRDINVPDGLEVKTDPEIAALVLYSILENALDATAGLAAPSVRIQADSRCRFVALRVTDNGPGVAESFRPHLFQWGMTTKTQGLGSALAFAQARMRLLNGDLVFPSLQPEIGATFELRLALPTAPESAP